MAAFTGHGAPTHATLSGLGTERPAWSASRSWKSVHLRASPTTAEPCEEALFPVVPSVLPERETLELVQQRLTALREAGLWPHGRRDLWTDALGVVCLLTLHRKLDEERYLGEAEWVAQEVDRVLGRRRGIRMGESPEARGQHFRSQILWLFALHRLGETLPPYRHRALALVREIHAPFVRPGVGILARMDEDLRHPFPGSGPGRVEVFLALAVYRLLGDEALSAEIEEVEGLVERTYRSLAPDHGIDLGLLLWTTHFFPREDWSVLLRERVLMAMDARWVDPPGYFRRNLAEPWSGPLRPHRLALTNLTMTVGLQAHGVWPHRVRRVQRYFLEDYPWEREGQDPLGLLLTCASLHPGLLLQS